MLSTTSTWRCTSTIPLNESNNLLFHYDIWYGYPAQFALQVVSRLVFKALAKLFDLCTALVNFIVRHRKSKSVILKVRQKKSSSDVADVGILKA